MAASIKTQGIVLGFTRYKDSAIITQIYTREMGKQSYIVHGARSSRNRKGGKAGKMALYQPLTFLDLVADHKEHREVQRLSEAKLLYPFQSIPFDFRKSTIALFLSEMLTKALREESPNNTLFEFLYRSLIHLDQQASGYENFHLQFLLQCSNYMGFGVDSGKEWLEQLQLKGVSDKVPIVVDALLTQPFNSRIPLTGQLRSELLYWIIRFYQLHLGGFGQVKSLSVLQELWR